MKNLKNKKLWFKNENNKSANFAKKTKSNLASHSTCIKAGTKLKKNLDQNKKDYKTCDSSYNDEF